MRGAVALAIVVAVGAVLVLTRGEATIGGMSPDQLASLAWLSAVGIVVFGWVVGHFLGRWDAALGALAFWLAMAFGLVALYSYRFELHAVVDRVMGELTPGTTVTSSGGEVSIMRRGDGEFVVAGRVNGRDSRFVFDTGASTVVLTAETARQAGIDPARLTYSEVVSTANGRAFAASVMLDSLAIGGIVETRVLALVAKPGTLWQNLLGMSFLDRLASYEVRGNRLLLRGRGFKASAREA